MNIFRLLTPATYWLLIVMWIYILFFYIKRIRLKRVKSRLFITLIVILAIDAFRTLFESLYFGAWYTSLAGLLPMGLHDFLVRPEMVIIPKSLNVVAAALVICILLLRWLPHEEYEREQQDKHVQELTQSIEYCKQTEEALQKSHDELEIRVQERTAELVRANEALQNEVIERKRAEEKLAHHRDDLEELVQERTAELQKMVNLMAGREVRMAELKDAIKKLRTQIESAGLTPVADDPIKEVGSEKGYGMRKETGDRA